MPKVATSAAPARSRVGLPIVPDGSRERPLLLRLPTPGSGACNNGCDPCLSQPVEAVHSHFETDVASRHVIVRHREPTLDRHLPDHVAQLLGRGASTVTVLTNGRMLLYRHAAARLVAAGATRFVVKLFGLDREAHDRHTRDDGSWDQALSGISTAQTLGAEVLVTFPLAWDAGTEQAVEARRALARKLTGRDPVVMPEPQVESHPNEYRYDVVVLRDPPEHPLWRDSFFPMAHVNTGPACNIRCTYCNVHGGSDQRLYETAYVEELIQHAARRILTSDGPVARPTIDFIGGEPTLHPELPRLVARAREAGFTEVSICTNGVLLGRKGYLDRLIEAGLSIIRFSFHDHREEQARSLADVPALGSAYPDVARMLLSRRDVHTHVYRIILASTIDALPEYLDFLAANNHTGKPVDLTFGMPSMRGRLFENPHLYPPLAGLREKVSRAIAKAKGLGIEPVIHHAPACLVPEEPHRAACLHVTTAQYDALTTHDAVVHFEGDARYGAACEGCDGRTRGCHGLPAAYWEADAGAAEAWLRPVRHEASTVALPEPQPRDRRRAMAPSKPSP